MKTSDMIAKDIMASKIVQAHQDDSLEFLVNLFKRCKVSGVPVINDDESYVGLVSKTDLSSLETLKKIADKGLLKTTIKMVMSNKPLICVQETDPISAIIEILEERHIHRVFVKNKKDKVTGVISCYDLALLLKEQSNDDQPTTDENVESIAPKLDKKMLDQKVINLIMQKQKELL